MFMKRIGLFHNYLNHQLFIEVHKALETFSKGILM